jgi:hypothetical protein
MNVPDVPSLAQQSETPAPDPIFGVTATSDYFVNWRALYCFHVRASMDARRSHSKRRWHASQARLVRSRHPFETNGGWSWSAHCADALAAVKSSDSL